MSWSFFLERKVSRPLGCASLLSVLMADWLLCKQLICCVTHDYREYKKMEMVDSARKTKNTYVQWKGDNDLLVDEYRPTADLVILSHWTIPTLQSLAVCRLFKLSPEADKTVLLKFMDS